MFIRIESSSGVPITRQILDQIRAQCANGSLKPGQKLPSVRELARELTVNQNTVLKVYEKLCAEGLLEKRHGSGTFVAENVPKGQLKEQRNLLKGEAERLVYRATSLGLSPEELIGLIEETYAVQGAADDRVSH